MGTTGIRLRSASHSLGEPPSSTSAWNLRSRSYYNRLEVLPTNAVTSILCDLGRCRCAKTQNPTSSRVRKFFLARPLEITLSPSPWVTTLNTSLTQNSVHQQSLLSSKSLVSYRLGIKCYRSINTADGLHISSVYSA